MAQNPDELMGSGGKGICRCSNEYEHCDVCLARRPTRGNKPAGDGPWPALLRRFAEALGLPDAHADELLARARSLRDQEVATEVDEFALDVAKKLATQDNACTADPMFLVERHEKIYGMDPDYADDCSCWLDDEGHEADAETAEKLESFFDDTGHDEIDDGTTWDKTPSPVEGTWRRTAYIERWTFVQAFLTRDAAEAFARDQGHRYGEMRVYVDSGYRNPEWKMLRKYFAGLAEESAQSADDRWRGRFVGLTKLAVRWGVSAGTVLSEALALAADTHLLGYDGSARPERDFLGWARRLYREEKRRVAALPPDSAPAAADESR